MQSRLVKRAAGVALETSAGPAAVARTPLSFDGFPEFKPVFAPREMIDRGVFGGAYYRAIDSPSAKKRFGDQEWKEFEFFNGVDAGLICRPAPNWQVNKYKVKAGTSLEDWEKSGWIRAQDPYGWFQWYCRFFNGRRSSDDRRQIDRWLAFAGPKGRFKLNLVNKIKAAGARFDDAKISPVIRQGLLQWGYEVSEADLSAVRLFSDKEIASQNKKAKTKE